MTEDYEADIVFEWIEQDAGGLQLKIIGPFGEVTCDFNLADATKWSLLLRDWCSRQVEPTER